MVQIVEIWIFYIRVNNVTTVLSNTTLAGHTILTTIRPVFACTLKCYVQREAANTNFQDFGLTLPGFEDL